MSHEVTFNMSNDIWQRIRDAGIPRSLVRLVAAESDACEITVACFLVEGEPRGTKKVNRVRDRIAVNCKKRCLLTLPEMAARKASEAQEEVRRVG